MATQHFFVGQTWLGSREIETMRLIPGLEIRPQHSYAYFCMHCGEIWGRLMHEKAKLTQVVNRSCSAHGDGRLSGNPEWFDEPTRFENDWPDEAVKYEFFLQLSKFEREQSNGLE